jgi:HK97 family phage major capsid protein
MEPIEVKLTELTADLKTFTGKAGEDIKNLGEITTEVKTALDAIRARTVEMQKQLDAVDAKSQKVTFAPEAPKSIGDMILSSTEYAEAKEAGFMGRKGVNVVLNTSAFPHSLQRKDVLESGGVTGATTGVLVQQRLPGLVIIAQQALRVRDVMNIVPQSTGNSFDFVYQSTRTNAASPQVEGSAKAESNLAYASTSGSIRTIAHFIDVSKQALADVPWLRGEIDSELIYGLKVKEEAEILSGDGTGVHLNGIITQATAFDTAYLVAAAGYTYLDVLRYAKLQARLAGLATFAPNAFVLNPADMAKIELTKNSYGVYIVGDPKTGAEVKFVWGLPVVESDSITSGTFLVGSFDRAASLIDRQAVSVDISYEHNTNFTTNMATVLCEERIGLAVKKAGAFITGSFASSPAGM